jgi:hypothetical protein
MKDQCIYYADGGKCTKFPNEESLSFCVMGPCSVCTPPETNNIRTQDAELSEEIKEMLEWVNNPYEGD